MEAGAVGPESPVVRPEGRKNRPESLAIISRPSMTTRGIDTIATTNHLARLMDLWLLPAGLVSPCENGPFAGLLGRAVIVVGADGKVAYTELVPEIAQEPDYDAALAALQ